ncbi:hypothetical protein PAHAL_5G288000 [Panicum hallii]|uniref:Uncharacterized protein n=1 Tax=Panicum hallii TaxID=206008 RepID=A0A2T8ILK1_9POAL|nr:hypothetical protein PAHAL_5G288000 [Panicum hallii]
MAKCVVQIWFMHRFRTKTTNKFPLSACNYSWPFHFTDKIIATNSTLPQFSTANNHF